MSSLISFRHSVEKEMKSSNVISRPREQKSYFSDFKNAIFDLPSLSFYYFVHLSSPTILHRRENFWELLLGKILLSSLSLSFSELKKETQDHKFNFQDKKFPASDVIREKFVMLKLNFWFSISFLRNWKERDGRSKNAILYIKKLDFCPCVTVIWI